LDIDARLTDEAEELDDAAVSEVRAAIGIAIDLDVHHLAVARAHRVFLAVDDDVGIDAEVVRHDEGLPIAAVKTSDDGAMRAPKNLRDLAGDEIASAKFFEFWMALIDAHDHEIAVHRPLHRIAIDVDVGLVTAED